MAIKIRLRRQGRTNRPFYRLIVADSKERRDGKYIEMLGWYNPVQEDNNLSIKDDRVRYWLERGAQLTEKVETLVARAAPEIIREKRERERAKRAREQVKRRTRRKAATNK